MKPIAKRCRYVTMTILPNGDLLMVANDEFREDFEDGIRGDRRRTLDTILSDLLEDSSTNGGFEMLSDDDIAEIGDLTDRPEMAFGVNRDDDIKFKGALCVWSYDDWMVKDLIEELIERGVVLWKIHPGFAGRTRLEELETLFETKVSSEDR